MCRWAPYRVWPRVRIRLLRAASTRRVLVERQSTVGRGGRTVDRAIEAVGSRRRRAAAPCARRRLRLRPLRALGLRARLGRLGLRTRRMGTRAIEIAPPERVDRRPRRAPARLRAHHHVGCARARGGSGWLCADARPPACAGGRVLVCSPNFEALQLRWWWLRRSPQRFKAFVRPHEHVTQFTAEGLAPADACRLPQRRASASAVEPARVRRRRRHCPPNDVPANRAVRGSDPRADRGGTDRHDGRIGCGCGCGCGCGFGGECGARRGGRRGQLERRRHSGAMRAVAGGAPAAHPDAGVRRRQRVERRQRGDVYTTSSRTCASSSTRGTSAWRPETTRASWRRTRPTF